MKNRTSWFDKLQFIMSYVANTACEAQKISSNYYYTHFLEVGPMEMKGSGRVEGVFRLGPRG